MRFAAYRLRMTDAHDDYLISIGFDPDEWRSEHRPADLLAGEGGTVAEER